MKFELELTEMYHLPLLRTFSAKSTFSLSGPARIKSEYENHTLLKLTRWLMLTNQVGSALFSKKADISVYSHGLSIG